MNSRLLRCSALLWVVLAWAGAGLGRAETVPLSLYDNDPQHLWNRLYAALMMRAPEGKTQNRAPEGKSQPPDLLDLQSREVFLSGPGNTETVALLGEFVKSGPRPEAMGTLQRAVMQRDLLAIFHLVVGSDAVSQPRNPAKGWTAPERDLAAALAQAIRQVALSAE